MAGNIWRECQRPLAIIVVFGVAELGTVRPVFMLRKKYYDQYKEGDIRMMRYMFLYLVLFALLFCGTGCNPTSQSSAVEPLESSETRVYEVFGMDCPGCHGGLEKLVNKIPAVQESKANWLQKQLVVTVRPEVELDDEDIYDAIRRSNFTPGNRIN